MKAVAFCMLTALFSHITIIQTTHFHFFNFFKHPAALLQDLQRMLDINYNRIRSILFCYSQIIFQNVLFNHQCNSV